MIFLLPAMHGWALGDCCPAPEAAATAATADPARAGDSDADHGDAAGPDDACSCAFCQVTLESVLHSVLDRPGTSQRILVAASRDLSAFFLSEIYRPPLA